MSPVGDRIAFATERDSFGETCFHTCTPSSEIYVVNAGGGEQRRLTTRRSDDSDPTWSPDGERIAFVSDRPNPRRHQYEIYVMNAYGSCATRLTRNSPRRWDEDPAWQPGSSASAPGRISC